MSHASSDGVMQPVRACRHLIQFRFGLEFRVPRRARASSRAPLPARYVRIQAAWPPPRRIDRSDWQDGLVLEGGRPFEAADKAWRNSGVLPVEGIAPLDQPPPASVVLDRWLRVPMVPPAAAATETFTLTLPGRKGSREKTNHFLSVPYPPPEVDGRMLAVAGVTYSCREAPFWTRILNDQDHKDAEQDYVAVSFDRFWPPERASADYIVVIEDCGTQAGIHDLLPWTIDRW
jgi:hypothetical protein